MTMTKRVAMVSMVAFLGAVSGGAAMLHHAGYLSLPDALKSRLHAAVHGKDSKSTYGLLALPPGGADNLTGIVDEFGQYTKATWPGKLKDVAELKSRAKDELALPSPEGFGDGFDKYGGWLKGPKLKATGFFRTEKVDGRWWFVTPEGHVFISVGMDGCNIGNDTIVDASGQDGNGAGAMRRAMFAWLPDQNDPLAKHYGVMGAFAGPIKSGKTFDFYAANLDRKYGPNYEATWNTVTVARMRRWGFNTFGGTATPALTAMHFPYVAKTQVSGKFHHVSAGRAVWGPLPDPFDPAFQTAAHRALDRWAKRVKGDPYCLGYFVDNEMSWNGRGPTARLGIAIGTLSEDASGSPAKQEFLSELKSTYGSIGALNSAWGTSYADWSSLEPPVGPFESLTDAQKADMSKFVLTFARRYFSTIHDALHDVDADHLYLGCRFAAKDETPDVLQAASESCDVISFNIYRDTIDMNDWPEIATVDKPVLVGEFQFTAKDSGLFWGGMNAAVDQADRGVKYKKYVDSVADAPNFVGCQWFRYYDEPVTGRTWDGENANCGFVDVTDTPYSDLVNAATEANRGLYERRLRSR